MNLIILFGPPAVGKMTVGQELAKLTGYRLLHNHMTIDLALEFFEHGTPDFNALVPELRRTLVRAAAASDLTGMIFTFVWCFDLPEDKAFLDELRDIVAEGGGKKFYAELQADIEVCVSRHRSLNRASHKPKLVKAVTEEGLRRNASQRRRDSNSDFPYPDRHFKIDNTYIVPQDAARQIAGAFGLPVT